jgi:hypothetical protein
VTRTTEQPEECAAERPDITIIILGTLTRDFSERNLGGTYMYET